VELSGQWRGLNHRPNRLHTALPAAQEAIVVELRRSLLLSTDYLLFVVREFIEPNEQASDLTGLRGALFDKALVSC